MRWAEADRRHGKKVIIFAESSEQPLRQSDVFHRTEIVGLGCEQKWGRYAVNWKDMWLPGATELTMNEFLQWEESSIHSSLLCCSVATMICALQQSNKVELRLGDYLLVDVNIVYCAACLALNVMIWCADSIDSTPLHLNTVCQPRHVRRIHIVLFHEKDGIRIPYMNGRVCESVVVIHMATFVATLSFISPFDSGISYATASIVLSAIAVGLTIPLVFYTSWLPSRPKPTGRKLLVMKIYSLVLMGLCVSSFVYSTYRGPTFQLSNAYFSTLIAAFASVYFYASVACAYMKSHETGFNRSNRV